MDTPSCVTHRAPARPRRAPVPWPESVCACRVGPAQNSPSVRPRSVSASMLEHGDALRVCSRERLDRRQDAAGARRRAGLARTHHPCGVCVRVCVCVWCVCRLTRLRCVCVCSSHSRPVALVPNPRWRATGAGWGAGARGRIERFAIAHGGRWPACSPRGCGVAVVRLSQGLARAMPTPYPACGPGDRRLLRLTRAMGYRCRCAWPAPGQAHWGRTRRSSPPRSR